MADIKFRYLYRDGSNFKKWCEIVFRNPEGLTLGEITSRLQQAFIGEDLFVAHQVQIPEVFLYGKADANADDHCYHEFYSVESTIELPSDAYHRSIGEFIEQVQGTNWEAFDPFDRWLRGPS